MSSSEYMRLALEEGKKGLGLVHPNPPVGCVIVNASGKVVGKGAHLEFGSHHAEVNALNSVVSHDDFKGATVYVTLEPCAHEGKTPSCAKNLAKLPITKVVYAIPDPNPLVSGKGAEILRAAGKEVVILEDKNIRAECEELAEIFLWNMRKSLPFVGLKAATSQNGSLVPDKKAKWLTGEESRAHVHFLRSQYDAVLVGMNTFLQDDPSLNIRISGRAEKENFAVILDTNGRGLEKLAESNLIKARQPDRIIWVTNADVENKWGIQIIPQQPLEDILKALWKLGIRSVFVEGGAKIFGSFLNAGLVNRIYHYTSPVEVSEKNMLSWLSYAEKPISEAGPVTKQKFGADDYQSFLVSI